MKYLKKSGQTLIAFLFLSIAQAQSGHGPKPIEEKGVTTQAANPAKMLTLDFTISEDAFVNQCISMVEELNIANTIITLQNYGTRYHTKPRGVDASHDIKSWWQIMVGNAGRTDITVEEFNHSFTNQISVILTIPGTETPDEIIVIGGHLDCGDYWIQDNAPGADDNASGIATLTETLRVLLDNNFRPKKTVQIMAYAAEEVGLWGSADIAENYKNNGKNVLAVLQFDMTNYKGSSFDIAINNDLNFISPELNLFLIDLLEHYNSSGDHIITYGSSKCNYACSDHASWTENGFAASFPMEAKFEESNPNIHTTNDTFEAMGSTAIHSTKFVKLALEFVIETAKNTQLGTNEIAESDLRIAVKNGNLVYDFRNLTQTLDSILILDSSAQKLIEVKQTDSKGKIRLNNLPNGIYIAVFRDADGKTYSKKFILK